MSNEIKIYCDSACDLYLEECRELDVKLIPLITTVKEKDYADRIDISPSEFYEMLKEDGVTPKTSMVTPQRFIENFKDDVDAGNTIIMISLSSGISGSVNSAEMAKKTLEYDNIYVIDSLGASVGPGMMVKKAVELKRAGCSAKDIVKELDHMRKNMGYLFCPGSLEMLKRGGRISSTKAAIGTILNIKPICHFDNGEIKMLSKVRGEKAFVKYCINHLKENGFDDTYKLAIGHAQNLKLVELIKSAIKKEFGIEDIFVGEIGAVIGSHTGEGTVALFFMNK